MWPWCARSADNSDVLMHLVCLDRKSSFETRWFHGLFFHSVHACFATRACLHDGRIWMSHRIVSFLSVHIMTVTTACGLRKSAQHSTDMAKHRCLFQQRTTRRSRTRFGARGRQHCASNTQGRRLVVGCKWNHVMDPQIEQDTLETSKNDTMDAGQNSSPTGTHRYQSHRTVSEARKTGKERWEDDFHLQGGSRCYVVLGRKKGEVALSHRANF